MKTRAKLKRYWIIGFFVALVCGQFAYLAADNQPPYSYIVDKSYIKPNPAHPGRQIIVHWEFKINRLCPGIVIRTIADAITGASISYDPAPVFNQVKFGDTSLERTFFLPEGMLPGKKLYRAHAEYVCNPLQRIWPLKVQTPDIAFEVE